MRTPARRRGVSVRVVSMPGATVFDLSVHSVRVH